MTKEKPALRCAIYTRKSSEEGLEQDFNSLDAQREACEAFVASQRHEGWELVPTHYDDGGFSGGTMNRPALSRLIQDIEKGKIHVVVVYKVDRLTRALSDFARIVETFDQHSVSFVSVTQQFNTTSSMGRLTLNVLLSFAQFEREVTGERIRDKFAASRKKGMWMGGQVPVGYDLKDRSLTINNDSAQTVRMIFERYSQIGSVRNLKEELDTKNIVSPVRTSRAGNRTGGRPFSRGNLYLILKNRIYIGMAVHKGTAYPGEHEAIIDRELWNKVQSLLGANRRERVNGANASPSSLLKGILSDESGNRFTPTHTGKKGRRYRYYVTQAKTQTRETSPSSPMRIPAGEIESLVKHEIIRFLENPKFTDRLLENGTAVQRKQLQNAARDYSGSWADLSLSGQEGFIRDVLTNVTICEERVEITLSVEKLIGTLTGTPPDGPGSPVTLKSNALLKRCGHEERFVIANKGSPEPKANLALIKAVGRAYAWNRKLLAGDTCNSIGRKENLSERYVSRITKLASLAPDITQSIIDGTQPPDLTLKRALSNLPICWEKQRSALGFKTNPLKN